MNTIEEFEQKCLKFECVTIEVHVPLGGSKSDKTRFTFEDGEKMEVDAESLEASDLKFFRYRKKMN